MKHRTFLLTAAVLLGTSAPLIAGDHLDRILTGHLARARIRPLDPGPVPPEARVLLGQLLFFDKELSGNRDIACATCHHPSLATGDALSLSIGTGAVGGIGPFRDLGEGRAFIPRNAPEVFNRAAPDWTSMFWDSRIEVTPDGRLFNPAGDALPAGLESVLSVQAMFPVTSRDEMRGAIDDANELAVIADDDLPAMWAALMDRLLAIPEYQDLFSEAFPDVSSDQLGFQHAANAIADFENAAFTFVDSPWDDYVGGDMDALTDEQKRGAVVFFSDGRCFKCHSGSLLTDQRHHNIGVPQLGPGKAPHDPLDLGRARETGRDRDLFAFRTPPLRNVAATGPWMHNGAYPTLEGAVLHHLDPEWALINYDVTQLDPRLQDTVLDDPGTLEAILSRLDPQAKPINITEEQFNDLLSFLGALTSPSLDTLEETIPESVPSGLPVDELQ